MPRKTLKRFIPTPESLKEKLRFKFMDRLFSDVNLFHLNRRSVSLACFIGVFVAFLPVPGQMIIVAVAAFIIRCNIALSIMLVWISNPFTIPPMFFATYKFGSWLLDTPAPDFSIELSWQWFSTEFPKFWEPLLAGSLTVGLSLGLLSYLAMQLFWRWKVVKNWQERTQRDKTTASKAELDSDL